MLLFNCSKKNEFQHPEKLLAEFLDSLDHVVSMSSHGLSQLKVKNQESSITPLVIGNKNPNSQNFILSTTGVETDNYYNYYVAISQENQIKVFSKEGEFKYAIGRAGRGPGEFTRLTDIVYDSYNNQLLALDKGKIEVFYIYKDSYKYKNTIHTGLTYSSNICLLQDFFFVNGFKITKPDSNIVSLDEIKTSLPIHAFNLKTGEHQASFGTEYPSVSNYGIFDGILSQTLISCDVTNNLVVGILKILPQITGYDGITKKIKWKSGIRDFDSESYLEKVTSVPTLQKITPNKLHNKYFDIQNIGNGKALIQIGLGIPKNAPLNNIYTLFKDENLKWKNLIVNTSNGKLTFETPTARKVAYWSDNIKIELIPSFNINEGLNLSVTSF